MARLESMNAALSPLSDFTEELSAEHYVSVSSVLPVLKILHDNVCNIYEDDTTLTAGIFGMKASRVARYQKFRSSKKVLDTKVLEILVSVSIF